MRDDPSLSSSADRDEKNLHSEGLGQRGEKKGRIDTEKRE